MKQQEISDEARARESAVYYLREQGMTHKAIANRIGVSVSRVKELLRSHERHTKNLVKSLFPLRAYIKQLVESKWRTAMTAMELYELLNNAGVDFDVIEIFEGSRFIRVEVEEEEIKDLEQDSGDDVFTMDMFEEGKQ